MNKAILMGRLGKDPEVRYSQGANGQMAVARYSLAVDRRTSKEKETDFLNIVAFGKGAEFAEKYLKKGMKVLVTGHIQTGSYTNKDGVKVYTTDIVAEDQEFCESKGAQQTQKADDQPKNVDDFMSIPEGIEEELPFN